MKRSNFPYSIRCTWLALLAASPLSAHAYTCTNSAIVAQVAAIQSALQNKNVGALGAILADDYLDDGETKQTLQTNLSSELANGSIDLSYSDILCPIDATTGLATLSLTDGLFTVVTTQGKKSDPNVRLVFKNVNGAWLLYGNQRKYSDWIYVDHHRGATFENFYVSYGLDKQSANAVQSLKMSVLGSTAETLGAKGQYSPDQWQVQMQFAAKPTLPLTLVATITETGGEKYTRQFTVARFSDAFPSIVAPAARSNQSTAPNFSWNSPDAGNYLYGAWVNQSVQNGSATPISINWNVNEQAATSLAYGGPTLTANNRVNFGVSARQRDADGITYAATRQSEFCYQGSGSNPCGYSTNTATSAPDGVSVTPLESNFSLNWNPTPGATSYNVYMSRQPGLTKINYPTLGGHSHFGVASPFGHVSSPGEKWYFVVTAVGAAGESEISNEVSTTILPAPTTGGVALNLVGSWNLVGNSNDAVLDVAAIFGDKTKVVSVWKWMQSTGRWAFYSPSLTAADLASYAANKNYDVLSSVNGGEGFWVNAAIPFGASLPAGSAIASTSFRTRLGTGWNLISTGDNKTPLAFNNGLSDTPPSPSQVAAPVLTSLWAWNSDKSGWYFYAPSLDNEATLSSYIASKSYLNFSAKTLAPGMGFWVNKP
ncbi:MAG TPA: hypothetical protein VJ001_15245 [Rhodocyclaceae bacterium]|nr:hypothetical protein [Rhodocyclaceae bacterium]